MHILLTKSKIVGSVTIMRRALCFVGFFFLLQIGWQCLRGTAVERAVIHDATVWPAAFLVNIVTPAAQAHADEFQLRANGNGLAIVNGCEGMDALFLLIAAFAVAPFPWRARRWGLLLGAVIVFVVNQARILALFYVHRVDLDMFDRLHEIVAPIVVVLMVAGYFYGWLLYSSRRASSTA